MIHIDSLGLGVFDVCGSIDKQSSQWKQFQEWCDENHLHATNLAHAAARIKSELCIVSKKDAQFLKTAINDTQSTVLTQIILAGSLSEDIYLLQHNEYKTVHELASDLDPQKKETAHTAAMAAAMQAQEEVFKGVAEWNPNRNRWRIYNQYNFHRLQLAAKNAFDSAYEQAYAACFSQEPALTIAPQSAVFPLHPTVVFIARRAQNRQGKAFGFGVHPVEPSMLLQTGLITQNQVERKTHPLQYDSQQGCVVRLVYYFLQSQEGPLLGQEREIVEGADAVSVFAQALVQNKTGLLCEKKNQDFLDELNGFFDLLSWYKKKLTELGDISSVARAADYIEDLLLKPIDVPPAQQEVFY